MVGAGEAHNELATRVERREANRAHDRLGAGHVEGHLVELGDRLDHGEVLADDGMKRAEHGAEILGLLPTLGDPTLVLVVSADVDAVRAGDVDGGVAVEILDGGAHGRDGEGRDVELLADELLEGEGHAVGVREAKVGDAVEVRLARLLRLGELLVEGLGELVHAVAALGRDVGGGAVGAEELILAEGEGAEDAGREARAVGGGGRGLRGGAREGGFRRQRGFSPDLSGPGHRPRSEGRDRGRGGGAP